MRSFKEGNLMRKPKLKGRLKLKTKRGVAKRFKLSKRGKVRYSAGGKSHLASSKTRKKKRSMRRRRTLAAKKEARFVKSMLPYG